MLDLNAFIGNLLHFLFYIKLEVCKMAIKNIQNNGLGPKVMKLFSCSAKLSMKISLLISMKIPTIIGIFIFIS